MSTKKSMLDAPKKLVFKAINKTKTVANSVNDYALNTTEEIVSETIIVAEQWQTVANKAIKDSIKLADKQQNMVFDALTGMKNHVMLGKKRMVKLFA
jgi:hypothetical protein